VITQTKKERNKMAKPSVSLVGHWDLVAESDKVKVSVGQAVFADDYWKVEDKVNKKVKYFYGEFAWANARRFASDLDFAIYW
jgi:hypothetical protein